VAGSAKSARKRASEPNGKSRPAATATTATSSLRTSQAPSAAAKSPEQQSSPDEYGLSAGTTINFSPPTKAGTLARASSRRLG
jgi:hypothetical protein